MFHSSVLLLILLFWQFRYGYSLRAGSVGDFNHAPQFPSENRPCAQHRDASPAFIGRYSFSINSFRTAPGGSQPIGREHRDAASCFQL